MRTHFLLALLLALPVAAQPTAGRAPAAADVSHACALLVWQADNRDSAGFKADVVALAGTLAAAGWDAKRIVPAPVPGGFNEDTLSTLMTQAFGAPCGDADAKLFYYSGHGGSLMQDLGVVDESGAAPQDDGSDERISIVDRDDTFTPLWAGVGGTKILLYDACSAGGMFDGAADPYFEGSTWAMGATGAGDAAWGDQAGGGVFSRVLRAALAGGAAKDANGDLTLDAVWDYVDAQMRSPAVFDVFFQTPVHRFSSGASPVLGHVPAAGAPAGPLPALEKGRKRCSDSEPFLGDGGRSFRATRTYDLDLPDPAGMASLSGPEIPGDGSVDVGGVLWEGGLDPSHVLHGGDPALDLLVRPGTAAFTLDVHDDAWGLSVGAMACTDVDGDGTSCDASKGEMLLPFCGSASGTLDPEAVDSLVVFLGPTCDGVHHPIHGSVTLSLQFS